MKPPEQSFARLEGQIQSFGTLPSNWNSYGCPPMSIGAVGKAKELLGILRTHAILPTRISPSPEGSVLFEVACHEHQVLVELFGDEPHVVVENFKNRPPKIREVNTAGLEAFIAEMVNKDDYA